MHIAPGQGQTTPWGRMLMSTESPYHFAHPFIASFKTISLKYHFKHILNDFIHGYSPRTGKDNPSGTKFWCQQKFLITLPICCKFKMISSKSDFIHIFNDFIHVYSPGARAENSLGTNFWCQQKALITLTICCKLQTNLFEFRFYTHFLMFSTCI